MTITVTPDPDPVSGPPKVTGQVSVTVGSLISSLEVYRTDPNGRVLVRTQPTPGFDLGNFEDFDCPYGVDVVYDWNAVYTDPAMFTTLFNETWASLAAWTTDSGSFNVASSTARNAATGSGKMHRSMASARYRVTISSLNAVSGRPVEVWLLKDAGGDQSQGYVRLRTEDPSSGIVLTVDVYQPGKVNTSSTTGINPTQPVTVDILDAAISVTGTGGSTTALASFEIARVEVRYSNASSTNQLTVGPIKVESYPGPSVLGELSDTIVLDPDDDWIVQPAIPAQSVRVRNTPAGRKQTGVKEFGDVDNASNESLHYIMGSPTPVSTSTGERGDDVTSMTLWVPDGPAEDELKTALRAGIPLLFQFNPLRTTHRFESGFYSVGKTRRSRQDKNPYRGVQARLVDLPLTKAQSPVVVVETSGFTLADLDLAFSSLADVRASYASLEDLRVDNRS